MGIKEVQDLLIFVCKLAEGFVKTLDDKKFNVLELVNFVPAVTALPAAISGIEDIPAELVDMDDAEREELLAAIADEFDIDADEVEEFVEDALGVVLSLVQLILRIKDL